MPSILSLVEGCIDSYRWLVAAVLSGVYVAVVAIAEQPLVMTGFGVICVIAIAVIGIGYRKRLQRRVLEKDPEKGGRTSDDHSRDVEHEEKPPPIQVNSKTPMVVTPIRDGSVVILVVSPGTESRGGEGLQIIQSGAGVGEKDTVTLTEEEKQRFLTVYRQGNGRESDVDLLRTASPMPMLIRPMTPSPPFAQSHGLYAYNSMPNAQTAGLSIPPPPGVLPGALPSPIFGAPFQNSSQRTDYYHPQHPLSHPFAANSAAAQLGDLDRGSFRPDGDINFERDFGQWFNSDELSEDSYSTGSAPETNASTPVSSRSGTPSPPPPPLAPNCESYQFPVNAYGASGHPLSGVSLAGYGVPSQYQPQRTYHQQFQQQQPSLPVRQMSPAASVESFHSGSDRSDGDDCEYTDDDISERSYMPAPCRYVTPSPPPPPPPTFTQNYGSHQFTFNTTSPSVVQPEVMGGFSYPSSGVYGTQGQGWYSQQHQLPSPTDFGCVQRVENGQVNYYGVDRVGSAGGFGAVGLPATNQYGSFGQGESYLGIGGFDQPYQPSYTSWAWQTSPTHTNGNHLASLHDLEDRKEAIQNEMAHLEYRVRSLHVARLQMTEDVFFGKLGVLEADLVRKRDELGRVTQMVNSMYAGDQRCWQPAFDSFPPPPPLSLPPPPPPPPLLPLSQQHQQNPGQPGQSQQQQPSLQQESLSDMFPADFMTSVASQLEDFDSAMFRPEGDINFERDFGQWFNPDDTLDMK